MLSDTKVSAFIKKMGIPVKKINIGSCESYLFFEIGKTAYYLRLTMG
jgi:hypothetical protein